MRLDLVPMPPAVAARPRDVRGHERDEPAVRDQAASWTAVWTSTEAPSIRTVEVSSLIVSLVSAVPLAVGAGPAVGVAAVV